jgi:hypothetical protein
MRDKKGNIRLKIFIAKDGEANIVFLDEKGNIVKNLKG